jgi:type IV secretory pathway TrbD component
MLGYMYGLIFLVVIGYIIAAFGLLMFLMNIFKLKKLHTDDNIKPNEAS